MYQEGGVISSAAPERITRSEDDEFYRSLGHPPAALPFLFLLCRHFSPRSNTTASMRFPFRDGD